MSKIIAVDFEGTLVERRYPEIGPPNVDVFRKLAEEKKKGNRIILVTCREGKMLDIALDFCRKFGIEFDAANDNLPDVIEGFGFNPRKVYADEYWEDRARLFEEPSCDNCPNRKHSSVKKKNIYTWCANTCKNYRPK